MCLFFLIVSYLCFQVCNAVCPSKWPTSPLSDSFVICFNPLALWFCHYFFQAMTWILSRIYQDKVASPILQNSAVAHIRWDFSCPLCCIMESSVIISTFVSFSELLFRVVDSLLFEIMFSLIVCYKIQTSQKCWNFYNVHLYQLWLNNLSLTCLKKEKSVVLKFKEAGLWILSICFCFKKLP